jgi:uncharacterized protein YjiS (DUF1127 family)
MERAMSTITVSTSTFFDLYRSSHLGQPRRLYSQLKEHWTRWHYGAISRRELMTLDDRELLDIGLARADDGLIPSNLSTLHLMQVPLEP